MTKSTFVFPYYEVDRSGHAIRRYDHQDDAEGTIVAFCPDSTDAHRLASAVMQEIEHGALIGLLNGTHETLRRLAERLDT